jgi:predicted translin family RNA/ssDNA-binding protein
MSFCGARYLGGVLDFTGELNRYAVARATERDVAAVQRCRDVVDALMGVFLEVPCHLCLFQSRRLHSQLPRRWHYQRMQLHAAHQLDMHAVYTHNLP